ncbi:MAG: glyceraldehyde dehydrogenase subunit beta [Conexivisphaerales archaeon]
MYPRSFRYFAPENLQQAVDFALAHPDEAKYLAGGQSLIPMMKLRIASPAYIIDVNRLHDLSYIRTSGGYLLIGALTRHADIEHSDLVERNLPILKEAARQIADQQVRNLGTMAGSISHADPAADWPAVALACRAEFSIVGKGERIVKAEDFFQGPFQTALQPGEFLREIRIPLANEMNIGYSYVKFERKAGDFATVGVATMLRMKDNAVDDISIALTAVAPKQFRATEAEKLLIGKKPSDELIEEASKLASEQSEPTADLRGSVEFKKEMVRVFTKRAVKKALSRAGWGGN